MGKFSGKFVLSDLINFYQYDKTAPLSFIEKKLKTVNGAVLSDISYVSPKNGKVSAFLVKPARKGKYPAVIFGHGGYGVRSEYLSEAILYARNGIVSLLVDFPWVRPAEWRKNFTNLSDVEADYQIYLQSVLDIRRGVDLLQSLDYIDKEKIGYIGHSIGAQLGVIATAVDPRIKICAVVGGVPRTETPYKDNDDPMMIWIHEQFPIEHLKNYFERMSDFDPVDYVRLITPRPLLFQFARIERYFGERSMNEYYNAAQTPKKILWYYTGHELADFQSVIDRANWLEKYFRMKGFARKIWQIYKI
jgi:cephalosporin-C deacetylase-like acetyl esterase